MNILKTCDTGWIVVNYGVPISSTYRYTRQDSIAEYCRDHIPKERWAQLRRRGTVACIKVRLVKA